MIALRPVWFAAALAAFPSELAAEAPEPYVPLLRDSVALNLHSLLDAGLVAENIDVPPARRLRLGVDVELPREFFVLLQGELVPDPDPRLLDAQLLWAANPFAVLAAGLGKVPFGRQNLVPVAFLQLPERALASQTDREGGVVPDRRLGAELGADLGLVTYALGVYAGQTGLPPADGGGWLAAGRLELRPIGPIGLAEGDIDPSDAWYSWPRLALGGSFYRQEATAFERTGAGADVAFKLLGLSISGEAVWAATTSRGSSQKLLGGYGQAGYFFWRGLEAVARAGTTNTSEWEATGGLSLWWLARHARLHLFHTEGEHRSDTTLDFVGWF